MFDTKRFFTFFYRGSLQHDNYTQTVLQLPGGAERWGGGKKHLKRLMTRRGHMFIHFFRPFLQICQDFFFKLPYPLFCRDFFLQIFPKFEKITNFKINSWQYVTLMFCRYFCYDMKKNIVSNGNLFSY